MSAEWIEWHGKDFRPEEIPSGTYVQAKLRDGFETGPRLPWTLCWEWNPEPKRLAFEIVAYRLLTDEDVDAWEAAQ